MNRSRLGIRWWALCALTAGTLFQTTSTTSCNSVAVSAASSLTAAIVNQSIRSNVNQFMGLSTTSSGSSSLTSLLGSGT